MKPELKLSIALSSLFCAYTVLCFFLFDICFARRPEQILLSLESTILVCVCTLPFFFVNYWLLQRYFFEKRKNSGIRMEWVKAIKSGYNYKTLINRISDGFLSLDKDLRFTYANDKILRMTGKTANGLIGRHISEVFPEAVTSDTYRLINEAFKTQRYVSNTDYYAPLNLWQENHIYPSENGLSLFIRDISDKKLAQLQMEKREKRFRALIEHSEDIILLIDARGKIIYVSPAFERLSGFCYEEVLGRKLFGLMTSEHVQATRQKLKDLLKKPDVLVHMSSQLPAKQGRLVLIEGTVQNLLADRDVEAIVCNFRDITEKKRNEAHIQESESLYRNLFTNMMHGFVYGKAIVEAGKVVDYTYMAVNEAYEKLTGLKDVTGKTISQILPAFAGSNPGFFEAISRVVLEGQQVNLEIFVAPLGRWYSTALYSPKEGCFVSLFDDITAKKKLDEQQSLFASIVSSSQDAIFSCNEKGFISSWNYSAEKLFGYTPEEAIGMDSRMFIPGAQAGTASNPKPGEGVRHFETEVQKKNGSIVAISLTISPILNEQGTERGASVIARDITERKASEEKIRYSENNLHTIIENSTEGFILTDRNLTIKAFNTKARNSIMPQFGDEQIEEGKNILEHIYMPRRQAVRKTLARALQGETIHYESNFYKKEGQLVWFHISFTPVRENDDITGACIAFRDITTRKKSEEKIIQSEENLRTIFENTTQAFTLLDTDGTIKSFNERAVKYALLAYGIELREGGILYDLMEHARVEAVRSVITKVLSGKSLHYQKAYRGMHGRELWLDFVLAPVWRHEQISGICITANDITEKKKLEQEREFDKNNLESLINNTSDMMWSVDRELQLITCNKPFERMIKQATGKMPGKDSGSLISFFSKEAIERYENYYRRAFSGEAFTEVEYDDPGGQWFENSFYPIYNGNEVVGTACFSRDITERKKYEEDLRKSTLEKEIFIKELSQSNKDLQQFAYITSHNLRGPIASLLGLTNLLGNFDIKDDTLARILDGIQKAAQRFDETIKDLNTILTVKENSVPKTEFLNFAESFEKAMALCETPIEECGADIRYDFHEAPGVHFNKAFLESIFLNLLTNAIKYRDTSRRLLISTSTTLQGEQLVLRFSDNGIGLDLAQHGEKLFKLYQRFHYSREGKGMGLFLIKSQLESFGATIQIESAPDKGATFIIKFLQPKH